jgi:hypothetical protein
MASRPRSTSRCCGLAVSPQRELPEALIAEARTSPGGWVYEIVGDFGPEDAVPPTAIRGAWKVNDEGEIVGNFVPNPRFAPPGEPPSDSS